LELAVPWRGSRILTTWKREDWQVNHQLDGRCGMEKKQYVPPKVLELGTVRELTKTTPEADKCSGSGDVRTVQDLSPNYSTDCP
jgi:hypothetical protein